MSVLGTDVELPPSALERLRAIEPRAIGYGNVTGVKHHLVAHLRKMQKRGELVPQYRFARLNRRTGIVTIPYIRLKTQQQIRRRQAIRWTLGLLAALGAAYGIGWMIWSVLHLLVTLAFSFAGIIVLALALGGHWVRGCSGIHCEGCRG